ncbi:MAG: tetratricopeptide repeat protein, partial [Bradymonadia bacterium]
LDKSVGCYSAEIGVVCGFRFLEFTHDGKQDYLTRLHELLNNGALKRLVGHWSAIVDGRMNARSIERSSETLSMDDVLRDCVRLYGAKQVEAQSSVTADIERLGISDAVGAVLLEHLAKAQELAGDVLSAFRTFERIPTNERGLMTKMWLRGWLVRDPDVRLAETLVDQLPDEDVAHHFELQLGRLYWLAGQTASAIRCYTKLMHFDRFRFFALNELGSSLAEAGRRREAAQFYAELAKTTRSRVSRRALLRDSAEWLESEGAQERLGEVYELLYREFVGEYEYVLRAKAAFLKVGQARSFAEFLERIRSLALSSADRASLELVSLYARTLHKIDDAKRVCEELVERAFHLDDRCLRQLATETTELALWPETVQVYSCLVERFENNPELFEMFAYRLASVQQDKLGTLKAARGTLEKILAFKPQAPEALERLADLSCIDGSSNLEARDALRRAIGLIERGESRARLLIKLAEIESQDGQQEAALRLRHEALSDSPADLVLVGQVVEELVTLGREREAGAALLKYELLNQGKVADTRELSRLRSLLSDSTGESVLTREKDDGSDGGLLIVRQMIAQTALAHEHSDDERRWLQTLERGRVDEVKLSVGYCQRLREQSLKRVLNTPRDRVLEVICWLDAVFSAEPVVDEDLPPRPLEANTRFTGDIKQIRWAALPVHAGFRSGDALVLSREIREFEPGLRRFFVQYFIELSELGGLSFTRWSSDHLFAMVDEFCRYRLGASSSTDVKRVRLREFYETVEHQDFERELIERVHQSIQLLRTIGEELVGSALELSLFASTSVETAFRGLEFLDESLGLHQRATETLMIELLPRTMLRHQGEFGRLNEGGVGR